MPSPEQRRHGSRSALDWYHETLTPSQRRHRPLALIVIMAAAIAVGTLYGAERLLGWDPTSYSRETVNSLLGDVPSLPPLPDQPTPSPGSTKTPNADPNGAKDLDNSAFITRYRRLVTSHPDLVEGRDYSFIATEGGAPIHWSCETPIPVTLAGQVPSGTEGAFQSVVGKLRDKSGLPLSGVRNTSHIRPGTGKIVVYYAHANVQPGSFSVSEGKAGRGGPRWYAGGPLKGFADAGEVVVRDDIPDIQPTTSIGQDVLAHEIMHALGLGHSSADEPEVMAPTADDVWPALGAGGLLGLQIVGCG